MAKRQIELRGVEVHNLKGIDLDIPHRQLVVFCGVSGSGKTSLAFDTLYAEGERRYIETFSAYTRQFLQRLEKPDAERIDGIPPAIAVTHRNTSRSNRSTIGTSTDTTDYLRLLYAKIGRVICPDCQQEVRRDTPQSAADAVQTLPAGLRAMIVHPLPGVNAQTADDWQTLAATLKEQGFLRLIVAGKMLNLADDSLAAAAASVAAPQILIVDDRLTTAVGSAQRWRDSLETAFNHGGGACAVLVQSEATPDTALQAGGQPLEIDGSRYWRFNFSRARRCGSCGREFPEPEPRLFSFNSPLGACPQCEGFGNVIDVDMDLVVPDEKKSIREGAIAPWTTPAYEHEAQELIALAGDFDLPLDVPYSQLSARQRQIIADGVPERNFGGLRGFFAWLDRHKYKMHLRVFASRWRSGRPCPSCGGARLRPEALAVRIGGLNIAEASNLKIHDARLFFQQLSLSDFDRTVGRMMLEQVVARLGYVDDVGLGYLTLDRTLKTLSGGESQRVALTSALGSSLVNMLYVLDEPSVGLHPRDTERLIDAIRGLKQRGNTVVVVEHEPSMLLAADRIIEIGPFAGERGGEVIFQGTLEQMLAEETTSITGDYLAGRRGVSTKTKRRPTSRGWLRLVGARGNNLKNVTAEFPLGVLCLVTGVSGSGKSTLVEDTLYPALKRRLREDAPKPMDFDDVIGDGQIDEVLLVDQSAIGRSPRSNPVTYIKAFDEIRKAFAETGEAKLHNFTVSHFSFNSEEGRCPECQGDGFIEIDMQFLADVYMKCSVCQGRRYKKEILKVKYRNHDISEVLEMTVREAFTFFRGSLKVQKTLKRLIDVGLDYLRLGQPANTLSGGEAQRLKLAGYMSEAKRRRTLFILDEPTTGLHFSDIVVLLECFEALLDVGHSLIVVEHNMQMMLAADYIIDLGPDAGEAGGQVIARGTPEQVAAVSDSRTGVVLATALQQRAQHLAKLASES